MYIKRTFLILSILIFSFVLLQSVSAVNCWQYNSSSTCISSNSCKWRNDSWSTTGWCEELNCWSLFTQSECTSTVVTGKNCTWQPGGTTYNCEKFSCWNLAGTNEASCENNTRGLNCDWSNYCYSTGYSPLASESCWTYTNQSACLNVTGCSWGQCMDKGCQSYTTNTTCNSAKDWFGRNCTWSNSNNYCSENACWRYSNQSDCTNQTTTKGLNCEWKWNSCQNVDCWSWDFTNATACINNTANLTCTWSGSFCMKEDCWTYNSNATCSQKPNCLWKAFVTSGWCNEVNCWTWDSWNGGNESACVNNSYGLSCSWSGNPAGDTTNGWCWKNMNILSCLNKTTERDCMDTFYCWWRYTDWNNPSAGGTCNEPGNFSLGTNISIFNEWNPGCYIFDTNSTNCNNILGCNHTGSNCTIVSAHANANEIRTNGINCTMVNSSSLCNKIAVLSSCCSWQNSSCIANKLSTSCRDQMTAPPAGASFCEDYSAYENEDLCNQIAGDPWYMPCRWDNSSSRCKFRASDIFGNETQSLTKIDNKKNCEAAGGKWVTENYCEGNVSVPTGRCESKFGEEDNCDRTCFACEIKDSNGNTVNATNAESACKGSKLGFCEFSVNTNAPNGIGFCKAKEQFKKGIAVNCDDNCGDCTYKGEPLSNDTTKRPTYYCVTSKANSGGGGCKWATDNSTNTGGYCINKGEKTCEEACDRCKTQDDCSNIGRISVANQTGSCKWQGSSTTGSCVNNVAGDVEVCWNGVDDNGDGLTDCADSSCFADTYCGFVSGDCFGWTNNNTCIEKNCEWVTDKWGSFCDFKGGQCWKLDYSQSACEGIIQTANVTLNIALARVSNNNINESYEFNISNIRGVGTGLVLNSVIILNGSTEVISSGNYSVNATNMLRFLNTSYMVNGNGAGNITNISYRYYNTQCLWFNGTGNSWCEKNWSVAEVCMGLNRTACTDASSSGCNWTVDSWCNGTGSGTAWCQNNGGWCDHNDFKPKNCWSYSSNSSCGSVSGCNWRTDQYSLPHCEVNWSANCWQHTTNATCSNTTLNSGNCIWDVSSGGSGWCMNKADKCSSYTQATCGSALGGRCYWESWGGGGGSCQSICWNQSSNSQVGCNAVVSLGCAWKQESGWCEESSTCSNSSSMNIQANCQNTAGCIWKQSGWCDPKSGGFSTASVVGGGGVATSMGADCYKYDGNQTLCTNKSVINISCGWTVNPTPSCEVNWGRECWRYTSVVDGCNVTNGCWFKSDSSGSFCTNIAEQCWQNQTYQSWSNPNGWGGNCSANQYCINNSWACEPKCFTQNSTSCNATFCTWKSGWCNPKDMNEMFTGMEAGAPSPLGTDSCPETGMQASVDLCGFGMKDMGDSYGIGAGVVDFSNASICNKEKLSSFVVGMAETHGGDHGGGMTNFGTERTGNGNDTVIFVVYLDSDGSATGGCALDNNNSARGYEFRFKYTSEWNANTSKASEKFNADKCDDSTWKATDIKLSAWKKKMCSDIGGPMIAFKKADLNKYPTLYNSSEDIKVYVTTIGNIGNISNPTDTAGPGWTTPGSIDFEIKGIFEYGADIAKFEDILKKGFIQGEDCFNSLDDDFDGSTDCNDWDCQYAAVCSNLGVSAANYSDTGAPLVTGVKIEEYPDAALVMYDTNKPTNGTLELYGLGDSQCLNKTNNIYDIGILKNNTVRHYKLWHTAVIYETNDTINNLNVSINWPLVNGTTYYYKLKVCDSNGKCSISKCSSLRTPVSVQKCGYCNFVTRLKVPTGWNVSYDVNRDGTYEHIQGTVCGPNAGLKTNYTSGRKVNLKLSKSDGSTYIEFLNASLTKTALNDKVRTFSTSGSIIHNTSLGTVGLPAESRDKIINNLHPEACKIKIPIASGTTCNTLYQCDDNGANCVNRTAAAGGVPIDSTNCIWSVPYCEFSTYKGPSSSGGTTSSSSGGGGGGAGGSIGKTYSISETELKDGYTQILLSGDKIKFNISGAAHQVGISQVTSTSVKVTVSSKSQEATFGIGDLKKFDVSDDGYYDLSVKLNSIVGKNASITVKSISEKISEEVKVPETVEKEVVKEVEQKGEIKEEKSSGLWILVVILIAIIFIVVILYRFMRIR